MSPQLQKIGLWHIPEIWWMELHLIYFPLLLLSLAFNLVLKIIYWWQVVRLSWRTRYLCSNCATVWQTVELAINGQNYADLCSAYKIRYIWIMWWSLTTRSVVWNTGAKTEWFNTVYWVYWLIDLLIDWVRINFYERIWESKCWVQNWRYICLPYSWILIILTWNAEG